MKNIHILPTDKPSRTYKVDSIGKLDWSEGYLQQVDGATNQNIYITNDEKIKEGDWFIDDCESDVLSILYKCLEIKPFEYIRTEFDEHNFKDCKKIILTTDQELIADGVQAIDDEFLEWFVKNPSCEEVEVLKYKSNNMHKMNLGYKIIIPKEDPNYNMKQETLEDKLKSLVEEWHKRQLRYEEVAENNITSEHNNRKFTYKAMATRDCWKELLKLIEDEKQRNT